jgi:ferritin-like metal-binding protein YciE
VSGQYANPRDLLLALLSELLWIERKLFFEIIPAVHDDAQAKDLQLALTEHRTETRLHCVRVEEAIRSVGAEPASAASLPLEKLKESHEEQAQQITHPVLKDVFHCAGVVRTEHYELACYEPAIALARELGHRECASLLEQNRDEDEKALQRAAKLQRSLQDELPR